MSNAREIPMDYEPDLAMAVKAAEAAGTLLREAMDQPKAVLSETGRDIKLQADRDAEALILEALSASGHAVLAEESGEHGSVDSGEAYWVVDPLDGTMNFSRNIPFCCVSIALCVNETPVLGVIHDFNHDDTFRGIVGVGAWNHDTPLHVSSVRDVDKAVLATGFPVNRSFDDDALRRFLDQSQQFKKVRMIGSAAMSLALVASGRAEVYTEEDIMLWDVAAGIALVRAAGGMADVQPSPHKKWARRVWCAANDSLR